MFTESQAELRITRMVLPDWGTALPFPGGMVAILESAAGPRVLAVSSSSTGHSALFIITPGTAAARKVPLDDDGADAILAGSDGQAYLGTRRGRLLRVDPDAETVAVLGEAGGRVTAGVVAGATCWFATADELIGLSPDGALQRLPHPLGAVRALLCETGGVLAVGETGLWRPGHPVVSHPVPSPRAAALPDGGVLLVSAADGRAMRLSADLATAEALPGLPNRDGCFCLGRAGDAVLASGLSGTLYRLTPDGWEAHGTPMPHDPLTFAALPDTRVAGVTYQGRLVQSTRDWSMFALSPLPTREEDGMHLAALGLGADRRLYFAPRGTARVGRWDPEDDEVREPAIVSPFPGEVGAFGVAGERLYLATADPCMVLCYYPDLPVRLLENPKLVGRVGSGQLRPVRRMVTLNGLLYFATDGAADEGGLVRIAPIQDRLAVYPGVVPGQHPTGVVADRYNHQLILGGRSETGPAHVACWSPDEEATVALALPFPDARVACAWAVEGGRAYITDGGDRLAILQVADGVVLETGRFPLGAITELLAGPHGELYGLAGGWLFHFDPVRAHIERLAEADGDYLTLVRRDYFAFTRAGRVETLRIW